MRHVEIREVESVEAIRALKKHLDKSQAFVSPARDWYIFDKDSAAADDGFDVVKPDNVSGSGRFLRYSRGSAGSGVVADVTSFGAKGDGATDDTVAIQKAIDSGADTIYFPRPASSYIVGQLKPADKPQRFVGGQAESFGGCRLNFGATAGSAWLFQYGHNYEFVNLLEWAANQAGQIALETDGASPTIFFRNTFFGSNAGATGKEFETALKAGAGDAPTLVMWDSLVMLKNSAQALAFKGGGSSGGLYLFDSAIQGNSGVGVGGSDERVGVVLDDESAIGCSNGLLLENWSRLGHGYVFGDGLVYFSDPGGDFLHVDGCEFVIATLKIAASLANFKNISLYTQVATARLLDIEASAASLSFDGQVYDGGLVTSETVRVAASSGRYDISFGYTTAGKPIFKETGAADDNHLRYVASSTVGDDPVIIGQLSAVNGVNIQRFAVGGPWANWIKPRGARKHTIKIWGAGGGAGSGRKSTAALAGGGGGGGGGNYCEWVDLPSSILAATLAATVGEGGVGGAAQTVNDTDGNDGTDGGDSDLGGGLFGASGGLKGLKGTSAAGGAPGAGGGAAMMFYGGAGGAGGDGTTAAAIGRNAYILATPTYEGLGLAAGGGGGGGGVTAAGADQAGAVGAGAYDGGLNFANSGGAGGAAGVAGGDGQNDGIVDVSGGAGGGGGGKQGAAAGKGGDGAQAAGGGGGGGGRGGNSGKGGDGGDGLILVISAVA